MCVSPDPAIADIINGYNAFVDRIEQLDLPRAIEEKPKLDVSHPPFPGIFLH
jgi:hypothetical protein